jgi:hypothetical protein
MVYRLVEMPDPEHQQADVATVRIVGAESIALFKEMVHRANNCWDTAPTEMKEFSDTVCHGRHLQNYSEMSTFVPSKEAKNG